MLIAKIISVSQTYLFWGYLIWWQIKQCSKAQTEVCNKIFAGWEGQTMWNLLKNVCCV